MAGLLITFIAIAVALGTSALFIWGLWEMIRTTKLRAYVVELAHALGLLRDDANPMIVAANDWEADGVMNPAAVRAGGKTHLFYRAAGRDGVSRVGYASSKNGRTVDERLPYPVFALNSAVTPQTRAFAAHSGLAASGGSWGGAGTEDPRAVIIDDRLYLSFNAFAGWNSLRIGVSSLSVEDLLAKRWKWTPPTYLSPTGQVHKNWVIFPEKINGKFAILHSLHSGSRDRVLVDYLDSLEDSEIESPFNPKKDDTVWDSTLRGAGPPPIKTKDGWLLLYHATDAREPHKYKIGALLLDLKDPSRVIAKAPMPVLAPDAKYENEGFKSGVVYACGATLEGDELRVYYGGADSVVCTAATSLSKLLKKLGPVHTPRQEVKEKIKIM